MTRIATAIALLATALALMLPAGAGASAAQMMSFEAPELRNPALRDSTFDQISAFGVSAIRVILYWKEVAPDPDSATKPAFDDTSPAGYQWGEYDALMAEAKRRGFTVLLTVSGPVPKWATARKTDQLTRPSPALYRRFMQAVATHYGDEVGMWAIWNEPNVEDFLLPQRDAKGRLVSPKLYRALFMAGQRGLRDAGLTDAKVLFGETAPRGSRRTRPHPLEFLRSALCLNRDYRRDRGCSELDIDGYAHHAYTVPAGPSFVPADRDDVTIGVLSRLSRALDRAAAAGAIPKHVPIYLTEFGIQSKPDPLAVSQQRQSEYRAISERIAARNSRVVWFSQYLMRDDLPRANVPIEQRYSGFESGLRGSDGTAKLSYDGFRLPLAVQRKGTTRISLWGLVRPAHAATQATIEYRPTRSGRWRTLVTLTTDARGVFTRSASFKPGREWRLTWTAPDGTVFRGSPTRAYR